MAPGDRIRVLVVDDDDLLAMALYALLDTDEDFEHVGRARTGEEALGLIAERAPDIVVMDVEMPGMGGLEATRRITTGRGRLPAEERPGRAIPPDAPGDRRRPLRSCTFDTRGHTRGRFAAVG